jgi:ribonucleoside-triphosphate reductase (formate)
MHEPETTDITLFVRTSGDDVAKWNRQRIVEALIRETDIDVPTAESISREVERQIVSSGIGLLTTQLIRELVNARLIERGLEQARRMHAPLGFPLYDVRQLILHENKENANVPHGPEGTNLILAEGIKREFAFHDVFSRAVGDAHIAGDIHLHGLGYVDRPYSLLHSLEYVKRFGLALPHSLTAARPARHAEVLLAHMVRFGSALQGSFAGVIAWDAVNVSFAPYLTGMDEGAVRQFAQMLIYEFSQLTGGRGGQAIFTDIHLYWEIPERLAPEAAIGPGGKPTGKTYGEYGTESRMLARALFEVFSEGDATEKPFIFPRPLVHITEGFFETSGHEDFLRLICRVAVEKGNTCFVFDRRGAGDARKERGAKPWRMRCAAIQNVTLNLPRLGYRAEGNEEKLFELVSEAMELAVQAHREKKEFMEKLLSFGERGPLALLTMATDGAPYLQMERAAFLTGMAGLNELVTIMRGEPLHNSAAALEFGRKIILRMNEQAEKLGKRDGLLLHLGQTPAETTTHRFARLDLRYFSPPAGRFVRGDIVRGEVYYTNSTHLSVAAPLDASERAEREGIYHPLLPGGAVTHLWLGEEPPDAEAVCRFIGEAFRRTRSRQVMLSPEFTTCRACGKTSRGRKDACPACGGGDIEGVARITQYYSGVSGWNKGKIAELRDRHRLGRIA